MRAICVFLGIALALCGMIQLYLMNIYSTPALIMSEYFFVVIGFLFGIIRYKIFDNSKEDMNKVTFFIILLLVMNIIMLGVYFSFPISDLESMFAGGEFILTMMTFEESTWFLLFNLRQKSDADVSPS